MSSIDLRFKLSNADIRNSTIISYHSEDIFEKAVNPNLDKKHQFINMVSISGYIEDLMPGNYDCIAFQHPSTQEMVKARRVNLTFKLIDDDDLHIYENASVLVLDDELHISGIHLTNTRFNQALDTLKHPEAFIELMLGRWAHDKNEEEKADQLDWGGIGGYRDLEFEIVTNKDEYDDEESIFYIKYPAIKTKVVSFRISAPFQRANKAIDTPAEHKEKPSISAPAAIAVNDAKQLKDISLWLKVIAVLVLILIFKVY